MNGWIICQLTSWSPWRECAISSLLTLTARCSWCSWRPSSQPATDTTHTHPFNGPFPGSTQVSRYQKGNTNLDFNEARDSEWQWHQLGRMQVCTSLQTDNHASTPPLNFLQAGCPSCRPTNSVKTLKAHNRQQTQYTGWHDVTESMATIRPPFCGYNLAHYVELILLLKICNVAQKKFNQLAAENIHMIINQPTKRI